MKTHTLTTGILALPLALMLSLAACSPSEPPGSDTSNRTAQAAKDVQEKTSPSFISTEIHKGIEQAKRELATKDIDIANVHIGHEDDGDSDSRPKAVITPQGDLVIADKAVQATPEQRTLLLDYRQQIIGIAEAGMDIGEHGANLGTQAAKEAIWGALTGKDDKEIEARIKPQADKIKAAAMKLCQRLPNMLTSQQKLSAAMPEFRPYATMTQKDVDDCGKDVNDDDNDSDH